MSESKTLDFSRSSIGAETMTRDSTQPSCNLVILLVGDGKTLCHSAAASSVTAKSTPPSYAASTAGYSSPSSTSPSTSKAGVESKLNATSASVAAPAAVRDPLAFGIEEEIFTLVDIPTADKPAGPSNNCSSTRVAVYKMHDTYINTNERRQELARILPSVHAVIFVADSQKNGSNVTRTAKYENSWKPFLDKHANQHMHRSFILPPKSATAPPSYLAAVDAEAKHSVTDKSALVVEKNVCNWQQVVSVLCDSIIPAIAIRLSWSEQQAVQNQLRSLPESESSSNSYLQPQQQQRQQGHPVTGSPSSTVEGKLSMSAVSQARSLSSFAQATAGVFPSRAIKGEATLGNVAKHLRKTVNAKSGSAKMKQNVTKLTEYVAMEPPADLVFSMHSVLSILLCCALLYPNLRHAMCRHAGYIIARPLLL